MLELNTAIGTDNTGVKAVRIDELESWQGIIYGAVKELGIQPWQEVELYVPKLSRMSGGEKYTYGCFDERHCRFVGNYWGITIAVTEVKQNSEVPMAKIQLHGSR